MFGREKTQGDVPDVPPSLQHDSFELSSVNKQPLPPHAATAPGVTPYLGLAARLSQIWFNRWTILLLLVLVRVLILIGSLTDDLADAKAEALSSCTSVEDVGSAMASMPHYLSVGVNSLAAEGITKAVAAMVDILMMILTGVEELILFVINMYIGTYACLIAALIHGGLDVATAMVTDVTGFMNNAIKGLTGDISNSIGDIQNDINSAFSKISDAASIFGSNFSPPQIDISGNLNDLNNIQVDDTQFIKDLVSLNATIPTFAQVENMTKEAISIPFDMLKNLVNKTYGDYAFDSSIFPVADKRALSFCSDNSFLTEFFTDLFEIAATAKIVFCVVIAVLAVLAIVPFYFLEMRRWHSQRKRARVLTKHGYDSMDVVYIASRPITAGVGIKIASRFSGRRQVLARWAVAYATSLPALFVLSLAIAGLFSCLCQFILLKAIEKEAPALASEVGNFTEQVISTLENVSMSWSNDANGVITKLQTDINDDVLGWVVNATTAVNNTLVTFDNDINKALAEVFNGTILYNTIVDVVNCLIGNKITAVEEGLTWVHDNAHVTLPLFPANVFSEGASDSVGNDTSLTSFLATPGTVTSDDITDALDKVITAMYNNLVQEALISAALVLLYVVVVLIGIVRTLSAVALPEKTRGEGGQRYVTADEIDANADGFTGDGRSQLSPRSAQGRFSPAHTGGEKEDWRDVDLDGGQYDDRGGPYGHNDKAAMASGSGY